MVAHETYKNLRQMYENRELDDKKKRKRKEGASYEELMENLK